MKKNCYEEIAFAPKYKRLKVIVYNQYKNPTGYVTTNYPKDINVSD
jgi:hypothetical protein